MREVIRNTVGSVMRIGLFCLFLIGAVLWIQREAVEQQTDPAIASVLAGFRGERYPYANDRMVYLPLEDGKLEQWTVDGIYQQKVALPVGEDWEPDGGLLWVDNQEIIWTDCLEEDESVEGVYSTPIERKQGREILLSEKTRKLFVYKGNGIRGNYLEDDEFSFGVYVNEDDILCVADGELLFYDRKRGEKLEKIAKLDEYVNIPSDSTFLASKISGNQILCHTGSTPGKLRDDLYEFWSYQWGDKQLHKIDARCFAQAAYVADPVGNKAFYQIVDDQSIWEYDFQTGQRREFLSEKQFRTCFEENGILWDDAYYNDSLFVDEGRVYLIKDRDNPRFFSMALDGGECCYEQELTEAVRSSGYSDGWRMESPDSYLFQDYLGHHLTILEGKILLYWQKEDEEEEMEQYFLCIDRKTGDQKVVTSRDPEKIFFGMIGLWMEPGTTGTWKPSTEKVVSNGGPTGSQEKTVSSRGQTTSREKAVSNGGQTGSQVKAVSNGELKISLEDQLAVIARYANLWMQKEYGDDLTQYYAVTDLDHNGRLEIITTSGPQGSGAFSSNHYYQVSADGNCLRQITASISDIDLLDRMQTVYIDRKTNTYYYPASDYASGGFGARYCWYGAMVLDRGMLTSRTYAEVGMTLSKNGKKEVWYGSSYLDGKEQSIKEKEFDEKKIADQFFDGLEKEPVCISWFSIRGKKNLSEEKILEKVTRSYQDFLKKEPDSFQ